MSALTVGICLFAGHASTAPAAPVISSGMVNSNNSVTLTGTAPAGSTVTVSDGGSTRSAPRPRAAPAAWSYTTADLAAGPMPSPRPTRPRRGPAPHRAAFDVRCRSPAAPVISSGTVNANNSVTLTGTAPAGATVTVSDGGSTPLGTTTASSTGAWSYTTADLAAGTYAFTATDTTSAGTSAASSPFDVTVAAVAPPVISAGVGQISQQR